MVTGVQTCALPISLFLYLHGSGPKEQEWQNGLILGNIFQDAPSLYFIPQIPNEGNYYRWWQLSKQFAWEKLIRQVLTRGLPAWGVHFYSAVNLVVKEGRWSIW